MSRSPERISSYRRHFEDSSSSTYQVRVSSPSPTRRQVRHGSTGYSTRAGSSSMCVDSVGRRTVSAVRRSRVAGVGVSAGALVCVGPSGEAAIDLDVAAAENQEFLNTRTSERQEMIVLNDRLAIYIDKVRSLEQKNKLLEAEIEAYQNRFEKPSGLRLLYEEQLKELKRIADQMKVQRDISVAAKDSAAAQLEAIKIKYEEAVELRKKAELDIETFRPDVDKATSSRIVLEKKLEQLEVEIEFFKRIHHQEIEELMKQIYSAHVSAQSAFTLPDLAGALKQIQTQYDDIAAKNLQEMDSWYKNKFEDLTKKSSRHVDKVRSIREEIAGAKKDIQSKERDLDSLKTRNEALEAQIREREEKYRKELGDLQARIEALQLELKSIKEKIALHLREYQDLLNIKMALEIEITTYRKLIEGEDLRLSGMMKSLSLTTCSMSVIGAGVSLSGGNMDAVGGMGGGLMGGSRGSPGDEGSGIGMGGGVVTGDIGSGPGSVGLGDRIGGAGGNNKGKTPDRAAVAGMAGDQKLGAVGAGVRATGAGGTGTSSGGGGVEGRTRVGAGGLGFRTSGSGTADREVRGGVGSGAEASGTGPEGLDAVVKGLGAGSGSGASGTGPEGLDAVVKGLGAGSGAGASGTGPEDLDAVVKGLGAGSGAGASGTGVGLSSGSMVDGMAIGAGGDITGLAGSMGGPGAGFGRGNGGVGGGKNDKMSVETGGHGSKVQGLGSTEMGGGIGGSAGKEGRSRDDEGVALLDDGRGKTGRKGEMNGAKTEYGSDGCGGSTETYAEQAVELTERRTVLIRTVKTEDDVLEMDHHEQTYTITGAADDSDVE